MDPNALIIHIDGSAITNPGTIVGCAGLVSYPNSDEVIELQWYYDYGTSGSMELAALVNAIRWINDNTADIKSRSITRIVIASDNSTVVEGAKSWVYGWSKNGWKTKTGAPVRNVTLWKDFIRERRKTQITLEIRWKKGKSDESAKKVDKLAKEAAKTPIATKLKRIPRPSVGRSLTGDRFKVHNYNGEYEDVLMRVYYHSYIDGGKRKECEVRFEVVDPDTGRVTGRYFAYASREIDTQLDRHHLYTTEFDSETDHPRIKAVVKLSDKEEKSFRGMFVEIGYLKK